jgi:EPS-associated MarR family transcriptional regulator
LGKLRYPATAFSALTSMLSDELRYKLLKLLEPNPEVSQREVARALGISLGKVNYCLKALMEKGWIKAVNFKNSKNKAAYSYLLTPRGLEGKTRFAGQFLKIKIREYEALKAEIEQIRADVQRQTGRSPPYGSMDESSGRSSAGSGPE